MPPDLPRLLRSCSVASTLTGTLLQAAAWDSLKELELKNGQLLLSQMRRVRQLGSGDVGLVDLVELNDGKQMCAP